MVIEFDFIVLIAFICAYIIVKLLCNTIKKSCFDFKKEFIDFGVYISVVAVFAATFFPVRLGVEFKGFEIYNLIPFKVPIYLYNNYSFGYFLYEVIGNILLFIPFGFFIFIKNGFNKKISLLNCIALTLFVEFTQAFIPYRFCEIDDVWLNTLGGFIGIYLCGLCFKFFTKNYNFNQD